MHEIEVMYIKQWATFVSNYSSKTPKIIFVDLQCIHLKMEMFQYKAAHHVTQKHGKGSLQ